MMVQTPANHRTLRFALPKAIWVTWLISFVLLLWVGGTLFCFPAIAQAYWPWPLTPFNTRFLGAVYLSAAIPLLGYLLRPRLELLRIILPLFACFTTYFFWVSIVHQASFLERKSSAIWFFLYGADSVVGLFYCWKLRHHLKIPLGSVSIRNLFGVQALLLGVYGAGLLSMTQMIGNGWPWPLDIFHSHLYSGVFLTAMVAMILWGGRFWSDYPDRSSPRDYPISKAVNMIFGTTQLFFGLLIPTGIWMVDCHIQKLDWTSASPWLWQGIFLGFAGLGGWTLATAYRPRR